MKTRRKLKILGPKNNVYDSFMATAAKMDTFKQLIQEVMKMATTKKPNKKPVVSRKDVVKSVTFSFKISERDATKFDEIASSKSQKRSDLLARIVAEYLNDEGRLKAVEELVRVEKRVNLEREIVEKELLEMKNFLAGEMRSMHEKLDDYIAAGTY